MTYKEFLENKAQKEFYDGFKPTFIPDFLFDFQKELVDWSLRKGRSAIFADCGLGKTPMQLVWAENVVRKTNKPVLILTPLAVSYQTIKEGEKFDIQVVKSDGSKIHNGINVTNYEKLHHFDPNDFAGVVCDESSILKNFDGKRKTEITSFINKMNYRLLCTATAAPNDYIELGTSSEALGYLNYTDMLQTFFKNTEEDKTRVWFDPKWILKPHGENHFWRWVTSWARALRNPNDMGYKDADFRLPNLEVKEHIISGEEPLDGRLFVTKAKTLQEQLEVKRATIQQKAELVAELILNKPNAVIWCQLNDESDYLSKIIPNSYNVSGSDSDEVKEKKLMAFTNGEIPFLITKPKIGGFGLNWQHCNTMTIFPSHSYEQYYQSVRRCWRFGQKNVVTVNIITSEAEQGVYINLERKSKQADEMFNKMVLFMNQSLKLQKSTINYNINEMRLPQWIL